MPTVEVVIKTVDQGSDKVKKIADQYKSALVPGLEKAREGITKFASANAGLIGILVGTGAAIKNAIDTTMKYAREVKNLAQVSGTTAGQASRLIQVLDDWEISTEQVTAATRFMTKAGLTPTIETLAKLSDEYLSINDAQEKNAFILKNLGRGGLEWVNVLQQGSKALLEQGAAVDQNLILTDKQIRETERYRLAIDQAKDTIQGFKIAAVVGWMDATDAQENATKTLMQYRDASDLAGMSDQQRNRRLKEVSEEYRRAADYGDYWANILKSTAPAIDDNTMSTEDLSAAMSDLNSLISGELGPAQDDYNAKIKEYQAELSKARSAEDKMGIQDKIAAETEAYNRRATAIIFNIQQEAILAAVQSGQIADAGAAAKVITDLAYSYGLVDEKTKAVADSTQQAIDRFAETGNIEAFNQALHDTQQYSQEASGPVKAIGDLIYHTGKRGMDAAEEFGTLGESASSLGEAVSKDAVGPVSALKSSINGLPPSGTSWSYSFDISVSGKVPNLAGVGVGGGGGHIACFAGGTSVTMADGTTKPIEEVRVGDKVKSYDVEADAFTEGVVTKTFQHDAEEYLDIDGLIVTGEHPIWTDGGGWKHARDITEGDAFLNDKDEIKIVRRIIVVLDPIEVYNLEVEGQHNYFAGGVLVHNKKVGDEDLSGKWAGGQLGNGWSAVGDAPGGTWTPYTELISPTGRVYDAKTSRLLRDSGLLRNVESFFRTEGDTNAGNSGGGGSAGGGTPGSGGGGGAGSGSGNPNTTGTTRSDGGSSSVAVQAASVAANNVASNVSKQISAFIAPALQNNAATGVVANNIAQMTSAVQTAILQQMNNTLLALLKKTGSPAQNAKANREERSLFS